MNRILVCDDEKEIVNAIEIYLMQEGYETLRAYNGMEAVECAKKYDIQLIIMDIMMPQMDGIRAMKLIREFSAVPIILLSAKSEDVDKIAGLTYGADDYVTKPFNPMELLARVKSQIRRYTMLGSRQMREEKAGLYQNGGLSMDDEKNRFLWMEKKSS